MYNAALSVTHRKDLSQTPILVKDDIRAVAVAELAERSLPIPEIRGSNPTIGKAALKR